MKQYEVLKRASLFLEKHQRETRVAQLLLEHHLGLSRAAFFLNMQESVPENIYEAFFADIKKHAETGVPVQHLMGYEVFYGRSFSVDNYVLIPRFETEELVQHVLKMTKNDQRKLKRIVDVGTGSGVIAITLALELEGVEVVATDISSEALKVAKQNASTLGAQVEFFEGSFLEPLISQGIRVDFIVSNPPYIAEAEREELADTVKNFDPALALFADENGLAAYKNIVKQAEKVLKPDGLLAFEIGHTQGREIKQLIQETYPQAVVDIIQDINKKDRIILARLNS